MKRNLKAILTGLLAAVFAISVVPTTAMAAPADNTAFIAFADAAWGNAYWGPEDAGNGAGVVATDATVTGVGSYTVGLDFTGTEAGFASGVVFTAPMIQGAATNFPGYYLQIDEIIVNGESVEFTKPYSNDEDGRIRSNVYNTFVTALPEDARTPDGDISDATPVIVAPEVFAEVKTYEIKFTFLDADGNGPAAEEPAVEATTEETATEEAPATDVPKTGVVGLGLVYGLGALATGAAALRRKQK